MCFIYFFGDFLLTVTQIANFRIIIMKEVCKWVPICCTMGVDWISHVMNVLYCCIYTQKIILSGDQSLFLCVVANEK